MWHNYCLINLSERPGKYCADNRFREIVIKKNKDKVRPFANAKLHEFLRKVVRSNIIPLAAVKEVLDRKNDTTRHGNHHFTISRMVEVFTLVCHLIEDFVFKAQLDCGYNHKKMACVDLYSCRVVLLVKGDPVGRYCKKRAQKPSNVVEEEEEGDNDKNIELT